MLKTHWRLLSYFQRLLDNGIVIGAFILTYYARDALLSLVDALGVPLPDAFPDLGGIAQYLIVLGVALPMFNAFLSFLGAYKSMRLSSGWALLRTAVVCSGLTFLCEGAILFILKLDLSRSFVVFFCVLSGLGFYLLRYTMLLVLRSLRMYGKNFRNLLIVGTGEQARGLFKEILRAPEFGVRIPGFVALSNNVPASDDQLMPIVATAATFESALKSYAVDEVVFTDISLDLALTKRLVEIAAEEGVRITFCGDLFSLQIVNSDVSRCGEYPLIHFNVAPFDSTAIVIKRVLDILLSGALIVLLTPLLIVIALLIKLDSKGPILFKQQRVGLNGRLFTLLKFRSMVNRAETLLDELRYRNEMKGPVFKVTNDPRVTRVGKYLRRYSLDELPQLFNVFKGDMSLVGPRPPLPEEVSLYDRKHRRRLSMRPGMTCTWQVSGRNEIPDFEQWANLDLDYIDTWSLSKDLRLLVKTVPAVVTGFGAR